MTPDEDRHVRERLDMIRNVITNNLRVLSRRPDDECQLSDLSEAVMGLDDVGLPGVAATLAELIEPDEERTCRVEQVEDEFGDRTEVHDCCADTHTRDSFTGKLFAFCPACGARVVAGDAR